MGTTFRRRRPEGCFPARNTVLSPARKAGLFYWADTDRRYLHTFVVIRVMPFAEGCPQKVIPASFFPLDSDVIPGKCGGATHLSFK